MTGYIDNTLRLQHMHVRNDFGCTAACRVEEYAVPVFPEPALGAVDCRQVRTAECHVHQPVPRCVGGCARNQCRFAFDSNNFRRFSGQRQRKISDAAIQIQYAIARLRIELFDGRSDHTSVDLAIDSNAICTSYSGSE